MKTKVICAALLAMLAVGINANANTLTVAKGKKTLVVAHRKAVNKKKAVKPGKGKKAKAGKKATAPATAKPAGK